MRSFAAGRKMTARESETEFATAKSTINENEPHTSDDDETNKDLVDDLGNNYLQIVIQNSKKV